MSIWISLLAEMWEPVFSNYFSFNSRRPEYLQWGSVWKQWTLRRTPLKLVARLFFLGYTFLWRPTYRSLAGRCTNAGVVYRYSLQEVASRITWRLHIKVYQQIVFHVEKITSVVRALHMVSLHQMVWAEIRFAQYRASALWLSRPEFCD